MKYLQYIKDTWYKQPVWIRGTAIFICGMVVGVVLN